MDEPRNGPIYVGYLPTPRRYLLFVRIAVPAILWIAALSAGVISVSQGDPGEATWDTSIVQTWSGTVVDAGYPMLLTDEPRQLLPLVEQGKFGARELIAELIGSRVVLSGWRLERDGRTMIELEPGDGAITPDAGSPSRLSWIEYGEHTLEGEIVDFKCYLGAMKPGDGRTHKACAALCIRGGIPPVLVTRTSSGAQRYYIVTDSDGGALSTDAAAFAGEPVRVTGLVARPDGASELARVRVALDRIELR
ncbi:MAG: hypothetical protein AAGB51_09155 [Planctomycetota bacterium]